MKHLSLFLIFIFCSCQTVTEMTGPSPDEKLVAENNLLKNKIKLIERENSVIKIENIDEKKNGKKLSAEKEKLESEMVQLNKKHFDEKLMMEKQYQNLLDKNQILEKESGEKIKMLSQLNKQLEEKMILEIKKLYAEMNSKVKEFNNQKMLMKKDFAEKEAVFLKETEAFKNNLQALSKEIENWKLKFIDLEKTYQSLELENTALKQKNEQSQLLIKQVNEELSQLKKEKEILLGKIMTHEALSNQFRQNEEKNTVFLKQTAEELEKLRKEKDGYLKKIAELETQNALLKQNEEKNQAALKQNQDDLEKTKKENDLQLSKIKDLEKDISALKKEIDSIKTQNKKEVAKLKEKAEENKKEEKK